MVDLLLTETGIGGDIVIQSGKLLETTFVDTLVYICLFGGNYGHQTKPVNKGDYREYFWGNDILYPTDNLHDSKTERYLHDINLISANISKIESYATQDLVPLLRHIKEYKVKAYILSDDQIGLVIDMFTLEGVEVAKRYVYRRTEGGDFLLEDFDENDFFTA